MIIGWSSFSNAKRGLIVENQTFKLLHYFNQSIKLKTRHFSSHHNVKKLLVRAVSKEYALKVLGVKTFSNEEIRKSFKELQGTHHIESSSTSLYSDEDAIDLEDGIIAKLQSYYSKKSSTVPSSDELNRAAIKISALLTDQKDLKSIEQGRKDRILLTYDEYHEKVIALGKKLDPRTSNIALSFLLAGSSVGIIIPCMPILVTQLAIPSYEFGLVNSAFGLSKLLGNIPSGYLVEEYGRKPVMIAGMGLCAVGMGSIGLSLIPGLGTPWLMGCRFLSGIGVSMFVADISTALNRTQTNAPVFAAFSGGTAVGPAVGTLFIQYIGLSRTYLTVGGLFMALAAANSRLLSETAPHKVFPDDNPADTQKDGKDKPVETFLHVLRGMKDSFGVSIKSWKELKKISPLRNIVLLNGSFWFALSGSQMTLLPLLLVSPDLHLTTPQIGGTFAAMSLVSFLASQPSAYLADKYGKERGILSGCAFVCLSGAALYDNRVC
eukprot:gene30183-40088_t